MIQLNLSSEVTGLINFIVCDIFVMAFIIYASSLIAGYINHACITRAKLGNLSAFDFPHVGGGLVMSSRSKRYFLIFLRTSALAAAAISNFGLEGRTVQHTELRQVTVRRPGMLPRLTHDTLFDATEERRRCAQPVDNELVFGAVLDGRCYLDLDTDVYISTMSLQFETFKTSALDCKGFPNETFHATVYHCKDVDLSCLGILRREHRQEKARCRSVIYDENGVWLCPFVGARPEVNDDEVQCRFMKADRQSIERWTEIFRFQTEDLETALFGAAYGREAAEQVRIPVGERNVTLVTLFWFIPAAWQLLVVCIIAAWGIALKCIGAVQVANDERGLLHLIKGHVDTETLSLRDWIPHSQSDTKLSVQARAYGEDDMDDP